MKGLRTGPPVTTLLTPLPSPLAVLPPTQNPIPDESVRLNGQNGLRGAQSPRAHQTLLSRARQPAHLAGTHPVLSCVAQGWRVCWMDAGCWMLEHAGMLTAWAKESVWVLGSLISPAVVHTIMCLPTS